MKKIQDVDLENKKVLLRVDFNVGIEGGNIREKFKIEAIKETLDYILSAKGAKVAMLTWLGRPDGKVASEFSVGQITDDVEKILGRKIRFVPNCIGDEVGKALKEIQAGEIILLENVRFHEGEKGKSMEFSKALGENFDIFVQDAFSVCHRDHASVTGVAENLPSCAGLRLQEEIKRLSEAKDNPEHPAVAIIGGAKIETKLPLIKSFEKNYDKILVGGKVANEAVEQNIDFSNKVLLPVDFQEGRMDIGEKTAERFREVILRAKTIVWNGPMGKFEEPPYNLGTEKVLKAIIESKAFSLVGGGESIEALERMGCVDRISFVSTGGGAMLDFMSGKEMPGIEVLT